MAEDLENLDDAPDEAFDEDAEAPPKRGGKKKLMLLLGAALLLVLGGFAAAYFTGMLDKVVALIAGSEETVEAEVAPPGPAGDVVFYDLPEFLVNLNTGGRKSTFLKIRVSLELEAADDVSQIERKMPRIVDNFQTYLRELRVDDLKGSAGMYRLREELLTRVSAAVAPAQVNDVLFKEMLVQ